MVILNSHNLSERVEAVVVPARLIRRGWRCLPGRGRGLGELRDSARFVKQRPDCLSQSRKIVHCNGSDDPGADTIIGVNQPVTKTDNVRRVRNSLKQFR